MSELASSKPPPGLSSVEQGQKPVSNKIVRDTSPVTPEEGRDFGHHSAARDREILREIETEGIFVHLVAGGVSTENPYSTGQYTHKGGPRFGRN